MKKKETKLLQRVKKLESQLKEVKKPKTFSEKIATNKEIMGLAEIASIFGVIKLGQSLSK